MNFKIGDKVKIVSCPGYMVEYVGRETVIINISTFSALSLKGIAPWFYPRELIKIEEKNHPLTKIFK
jgi:hypothetical protein